MIDIIIQAIGFIAIGCNLIAVQFNKYSKIILLKTIGSALFVLQYFLLGAYTGMVMDSIGIIRNIIFSRNIRKGKSNKLAVIIFSILTVVLGSITIITTWDIASIKWTTNARLATILMVIVSIISIIAKLLTTIAYSIKVPHTIRMINLPSCSCWLVYNFIVFSLAGILNEIMTLISIIIAEIRFKVPKTLIEQNRPDESEILDEVIDDETV